MRPKNSYRRKITFSSVLLSVIPVLFLGLFLVFIIHYRSINLLEKEMKVSTVSAGHKLEMEIERLKTDVENLGDYIRNLNFTKDEQQSLKRMMHQILGSRQQTISFHIVSEEDKLQISTDSIPSFYSIPHYENWGIYRKAKKNESVIYPNSFRKDNWINAFSIIYKTGVRGSQYNYYVILDVSSEYVLDQLSQYKQKSFGTMQFAIISDQKELVYNDTHLETSIRFSDFLFEPTRFDEDHTVPRRNFDQYISVRTPINETSLNLVSFISRDFLDKQLQLLLRIVFLVLIITLIFAAFFGYRIGNQISKPIGKLVQEIKNMKDGKLTLNDTLSNKNDELSWLVKQFEAAFVQLERYYRLNIQKNKLLKQAEIRTLMSQINPHFLYNTLDSIKWLSRFERNEDIEEIVNELGFLLRTAMSQNEAMIPISEEISYVESYLKIQALRYNHSFVFKKKISNNVLSYFIPKLLLQPIIENALLHGLDPKGGKGTILLEIHEDENFVYFNILDDGVGCDVSPLEKDGKHIGLKNVNKRIKLHYGSPYGIIWHSKKNYGTKVTFYIPKKSEVLDV